MRHFKWILMLVFSLCVMMKTVVIHAHEDHKHEEAVQEQTDEHGHEHADEHGHDHAGSIILSAESQKLGGIETAVVNASSFSSKVMVSGRIAQDAEDVKYVFPPTASIVGECNTSLGENVNERDLLCHVTDRSTKKVTAIAAPISGTIIAQFVKKSEYVDQTTALYAIADLTTLWANFDVYEKDIGLIKLGQKLLVYPLSYPDKVLNGHIVFISPRVDESTYTVKIRAEVENKDYLLKLGMSVRGEIILDEQVDVVVIPAQAIQTVEHNTVVFKKTAAGFEPTEVVIQSQTKETALIKEGINVGDEIVVKGSFILKSKMLESEMGHDHSH